MKDDFYIGWEAKAGAQTRKTVHWVIGGLLLLATGMSVLLAMQQRMIGSSVFEWGTRKTFTGVLRLDPYPRLLVVRPGEAGLHSRHSTYHLVAPWKFGLNRAAIASLDGKAVTLEGTLIYRGDQTMIETRPDWIKPGVHSAASTFDDAPVSLGRQTFIGEIVDSKCFLGVMNPGQLIPHRACAIRCISGGVPPLLLVRQRDGPAIYLVLVSAGGNPVNRQVLDKVAEPLEITGDVERHGELLILKADPSTYRRL